MWISQIAVATMLVTVTSILSSTSSPLLLVDAFIVMPMLPSRSLSLPKTTTSTTKSISLKMMAGMGMGATVKKKKGGKKKKDTVKAPSFNVRSALKRSEMKYDELQRQIAKQDLKHVEEDEDDDDNEVEKEDDDDEENRLLNKIKKASASLSNNQQDDCCLYSMEFIIAARAVADNNNNKTPNNINNKDDRKSISDWVPFANLLIAIKESDMEEELTSRQVISAISCLCREINFLASVSAPIFKTIPKNEIQYSFEPLETWHKQVYKNVVNVNMEEEGRMTKVQAREILQLQPNESDSSVIKSAYRKLAFTYHPDRFKGSSSSSSSQQETKEEEEAATKFASITTAYNTLWTNKESKMNDNSVDDIRKTMKRSSWYESLGGKDRGSEFVGPIELLPIESSRQDLALDRIQTAIVGLDTETIQIFMVRNVARAM